MEKLINDYLYEFHRTTGKRGQLTYKGGWFTFPSGDKGRKADVEKALEVLMARPTVEDRMEIVNGVSTLIKASQHVVQNLLSGKDVVEDRDTPNCCSVASETYWSMWPLDFLLTIGKLPLWN